MLDNLIPSLPAHNVSNYELADYGVKSYIAKYTSSPIKYPLKPVGLWNVSLLGVGLSISSIHCNCYFKQ